MQETDRSSGAQVVVCPYCGETQPAAPTCRSCGGAFEPLSRQATQNAMGPWFVRDPRRPYLPGSSYETLMQRIDRGLVNRYSIIRGPTTRQFWTVARRVPGVAHLLGHCHACDAGVGPDVGSCPECGVSFAAYLDRNQLGLPEIRPLPGEAPEIAAPRASAHGPLAPDVIRDPGGGGLVADLERRVRRQQSVIRTLTTLVFVVAAIGATASIVAVAAQSAARRLPVSSNDQVSVDDVAPSTNGHEGDAADSKPPAERVLEESETERPPLPIPDSPLEPILDVGDPLHSVLAIARDETRGVVERLAAYDEVVTALTVRVETDAVLGAVLEEVEAERELLRFREFGG